MNYSLLRAGEDICDLAFDENGLGKCSMSNPEDVVIFCLYILNMLEDIRRDKEEPQRAIHRLQRTDG